MRGEKEMFKSSFTIGKVFGIPVKIHVSFLLIIPFLAWAFGNNIRYITDNNSNLLYSELSLNPYVIGVILGFLLFASVLLHEISHSLVARAKGIEINDITLMLFGGVSNMEEISEDPGDEAQTALAGPLLSIVLGIILIYLYNIIPADFSEDFRLIILYTGQLNIFLAIFNLLPAFPSDGGRILRAIIATKTSFLKATKIASYVGKGFAFLFGLIGLLSGNFLLIFIGFFLYIGASQEYQYNNIKNTLSDLQVSDLMTRDVETVSADMSIEVLIEKMYRKKHSGYPVVQNGKVNGIITMKDIQNVSKEEYNSTTVKSIMKTDVHFVNPADDLYKAFKLLFQKDIGRLVVIDEGELKGIITRSDILRGFKLQQLKSQS